MTNISGIATAIILLGLWEEEAWSASTPSSETPSRLEGNARCSACVFGSSYINSFLMREAVPSQSALLPVNKASSASTMTGETSIRRSKSAPPKYRPWNGISRNHLPPLEPFPSPQPSSFYIRIIAGFRPLRPYRYATTVLYVIIAIYGVMVLPYYTNRRWVINLVCHILGWTTAMVLGGVWTSTDLPPASPPHAGRRDGARAAVPGGGRSTGMTAASWSAGRGAVRRGWRGEEFGASGGNSGCRCHYCHSGSQTDGP